jgi:hypothetical protein
MAYHVTSRWRVGESNPSSNRLREILSELDADDCEHPDASLTHESEWSHSAFQGGALVWENLEEGEPRHLNGLGRDQVLDLWLQLSRVEISKVDSQPWAPGYPG